MSPANRTKIEDAIRLLTEAITDEVFTQAAARLEEATNASLHVSQIFDVRQAARFLGISTTSMRRRVAAREIAYRREGVKLLFTRAALDEYIAKRNRVARY